MNRTIKNSRIKLTIFFVTSLFAMTLLIQATAYGQVPPIVRTPRTIPVATPRPTTTTIVKPGSPLIITGKPNIRPDISNRLLPDLTVTGIYHNSTLCKVYVQVRNQGLMDAGRFNLWVKFAESDPSNSRIEDVQIDSLARGSEKMLAFDLMTYASLYNGIYNTCRLAELLEVKAVADARYSVNPRAGGMLGQKTHRHVGELYKPGEPMPAGHQDSELQIDETIESNNELVVKKAALQTYSPPPPIRRP